jgi:DNA-binding CsgD family transcriptional regulator
MTRQRKRPSPPKNPWNLTWTQLEVLAMIAEHGNTSRASVMSGLAYHTVERRLERAKAKMGFTGYDVRPFILFDRWRRTNERTNQSERPV